MPERFQFDRTLTFRKIHEAGGTPTYY